MTPESVAPADAPTWTCANCLAVWPGSRPHTHVCPNGTLFISPRRLAATASCDTQAVLQGMNYTSDEDNVKAKAGSAWHLGMAAYFRRQGANAARIAFADAYQSYADKHVDPNDHRLQAYTYENTSFILDTWLARYPIDEQGVLRIASNGAPLYRIRPELVEIPFCFPLSDEDGLYSIGILDAGVEDHGSGRLWVPDHKTTGQISAWWLKKFRMDHQLTNYVWAMQEHTGDAVLGAIVSATEFSKILEPVETAKGTIKKCGSHHVPVNECRPMHVKAEMLPVERTEQAIEEWHRDAVKLAKKYRALILGWGRDEMVPRLAQQGKFNERCTFCFADEFCANGRRTDLLGTVLRREE